ncbi:GDSL-type esterase/lipase family protein [Thalassobacillus pellis]|uniref:GDSL-type esterase/lipase family protein n=1 Tax=Thalassobacillus pellis TaxID=748008 RepID=UPI0019604001|nr:GDSL-type esterase/lipase family protein [Thalassobacillus pellis]MBM7552141.1 lysophospholipase L1-like esterase [Thalassobacillus pellis]
MKKLAALLVVLMLSVSLPSDVFAKGPAKKVVDYVALGDSLARGVTPDNEIGAGYPDYLTERLRQSQYMVDYDNFSVPGATTDHLLGVIKQDVVLNNIQEAEFITIDIGANDLLSALPNPAKLPAALKTVSTNLNAVLAAIDQHNPNAKVYVMGYYNPFPYAPAEQQPQLEELLNNLNGLIQLATLINGDTYVPTKDIIAKNYQTYLPNPSNIHLSEEGYQAVAKEFWKKLDKSKND